MLPHPGLWYLTFGFMGHRRCKQCAARQMVSRKSGPWGPDTQSGSLRPPAGCRGSLRHPSLGLLRSYRPHQRRFPGRMPACCLIALLPAACRDTRSASRPGSSGAAGTPARNRGRLGTFKIVLRSHMSPFAKSWQVCNGPLINGCRIKHRSEPVSFIIALCAIKTIRPTRIAAEAMTACLSLQGAPDMLGSRC